MKKSVYGDFQTPIELVRQVLSTLDWASHQWARVLEPTCGAGHFIRGLIETPGAIQEVVGIEIQASYAREARELTAVGSLKNVKINILNRDIFTVNLQSDLKWMVGGPLLIVGNPPWITNAEQGGLGGRNLPAKTNFKKMRGIDALTGRSNFDIAEYILIKLLTSFPGELVTLAVLCKTSVARKVLRYAQQNALKMTDASIRKIDALAWFGAAADACLFTLTVNAEADHGSGQIPVFKSLSAQSPQTISGFVGEELVVDMDRYRKVAFADGVCPFVWRQGIKLEVRT